MHRAIVSRFRSFQPQPQSPAPPKLVLIEGGRSEEDSAPIPIVYLFEAVSALLFLHEMRSLVERTRLRRHDALAKTVTPIKFERLVTEREQEPATGVHLIVADHHVLDRIIERADEQVRERSLYLPKHVMRQYVRWVLCYRGGLRQLMHKRAKEVLARRRHQRMADKPFDLVVAEEFDCLRRQAKQWMLKAVDTGRKTHKGYSILESKDKDENLLFVTLNHNGRVVIGIYTEHQFGRSKQFSRSRQLSNQRARSFRKNKRVGCYRS